MTHPLLILRSITTIFLLVAASFVTTNVRAESYPSGAVRSFMDSCVGLKRELVSPCSCIIRDIQKSVPYAEYEKIITNENPMGDKRIAAVAQRCSQAR